MDKKSGITLIKKNCAAMIKTSDKPFKIQIPIKHLKSISLMAYMFWPTKEKIVLNPLDHGSQA